MATNRWRGDAPAIAQVIILVVGSSTNGHTFITTINGKSITYVAGGSETTSTIAAAIQALLAASEIAEFQEITWTVATATITGTAKTAGVPFTVSNAGTGTYTLTTVTNSSGPNHADVTANWSLGALPVATDDVLIADSADILYGLGNLTPAAFNSFRVKASYTGSIGLPRLNSAGYVEYRTRAWPMNTAVPITIGEGDGNGPALVNITSGLILDLTVHMTGTRTDPAIPVVNVAGCTSGTVNVASGDVGIAADDDQLTATVTTATINDAATLTVGKAATVTTANNDGGTVNSFGTITTLTLTAGTVTLFTAPTTVTMDGGRLNVRYTGTTTTMTARGQGNSSTDPVVDCALDPRDRTFTNGSFTGGAALLDPDKTTTWSNALTWDEASLHASILGTRYNLLRT